VGAVDGGGGGGVVVDGGGGSVVVVDVDVEVVVGAATADRSRGRPDLVTSPHACRARAAMATAASSQRVRLIMLLPDSPPISAWSLLALAHLGGVFVFTRQAPGRVVVLGAGAALGAGLDTDLGAALEGPSLFEAPMSTFLHVPPLHGSLE
jgi:hypothetical protein